MHEISEKTRDELGLLALIGYAKEISLQRLACLVLLINRRTKGKLFNQWVESAFYLCRDGEIWIGQKVDYKECTNCGRLLPLTEFSPHKNTRDGLQSWCKKCTSKAIREWRLRNPEKALKKGREGQSRYRKCYPEKIKAQLLVRSTELAPFCEQCGTYENIERHHPDYSKPREYMTLCRKCHLEIHSKKERK